RVEQITTWQPGEWEGTCQSPDTPFRWRWGRNRAVAEGIRALVGDLEAAFPERRLRIVIPERSPVAQRVQQGLETMPRPGGGVYGRDFYRHIWGSLNHIPNIGEGMALVDLRGTRAEPVFLGIRFLPDMEPLRLFVQESLADMADNHGSRFRGSRSYFYEAQETLRNNAPPTAQADREARIRYLLSQRGEIGEVILYEAADWTYYLPLSDPEHGCFGFLEH
ncbi:MAG: hypothetical protein ACKV0T_07780, partial [Planctomycetales bacterium]